MFRSAVDMSRLAPFVDAAASIDRTAWPNLFISYYTYGQALGLGLDLSLRDRSNGKVTGDRIHERAVDPVRPARAEGAGKVATPYTIDGLKETLAKVSNDRAFTNDFFTKYVEGRELVDYTRLLARAGLVLRKRAAGRAFAGQVQLQPGGSALRVSGLVPWESPLYKAGVAQDDQLVSLDGVGSDIHRQTWDEALGAPQARRPRAVAIRAPQRRNGERHADARRGSANGGRADRKDRRHAHRRAKEIQGVMARFAQKRLGIVALVAPASARAVSGDYC